MVLHNGTILLCGGSNNEKKCLQLDHGTWKELSILNKERQGHSAVTTHTATFLFGGNYSRKILKQVEDESARRMEHSFPGSRID